MSSSREHLPDESELLAPQPLREDLTALFGEGVSVPPEVDARVLAHFRRRLARPKRVPRALRWAAVAATAALVLLGLRLGGHWRVVAPSATEKDVDQARSLDARPPSGRRPLALAREDIDCDGRVDILDAFTLARHIESGEKPRNEWDVNGDGAVDDSDVDTIAMAAVSLGRRLW